MFHFVFDLWKKVTSRTGSVGTSGLNLLCSDTENTEMLPCPKLQQNSRQHTSEYFKHTLACQLHFASVISKVCENTVRLDAKVTPKLRLRNGLVRETKPYL